ncbi:MAG: hypothetical protein R3C04_05580 [Hyphomonas sp.]
MAPILAAGYNIVSFGNLTYDYRPVPQPAEKAAIAYVVGANDRDTLDPVTGDSSKALALSPYLLRRGSGPFATEFDRSLGERPEQIGQIVSGEWLATLTPPSRFEGAGAAFRASGWAGQRRGQLLRRILLTGASGRIIGVGLPGDLREDAAGAGIGVTSNFSGWTAWAAGGEAPPQLYADMEGGRPISEGIMPDAQALGNFFETREVAQPDRTGAEVDAHMLAGRIRFKAHGIAIQPDVFHQLHGMVERFGWLTPGSSSAEQIFCDVDQVAVDDP